MNKRRGVGLERDVRKESCCKQKYVLRVSSLGSSVVMVDLCVILMIWLF